MAMLEELDLRPRHDGGNQDWMEQLTGRMHEYQEARKEEEDT